MISDLCMQVHGRSPSERQGGLQLWKRKITDQIGQLSKKAVSARLVLEGRCVCVCVCARCVIMFFLMHSEFGQLYD